VKVREDIPGYNIRYPKHGSMAWHMFLRSALIFKVIREEHAWLDKVIDQEKITHVISDNRYGLYSKKSRCTFITHQLFIQAPPFFQRILKSFVKKFVSKFDECLVPDFEGKQNLSGKLSHGRLFLRNVRYIGPLSRFEKHTAKATHEDFDYEYFAVISGIETQRTVFQQKITALLLATGKPALITCGQPQQTTDKTQKKVRIVSHMDDEALAKAIHRSRYIICRSGYSTIQDLYALGKKAILVPTPGQTEQEYLAMHLCAEWDFRQILQKDLGSATLKDETKDFDTEWKS